MFTFYLYYLHIRDNQLRVLFERYYIIIKRRGNNITSIYTIVLEFFDCSSS